METIGYSLVRLADSAIVQTVERLPATFHIDDAQVDMDKAGLVIPDEEKRTHKLVLCVSKAIPAGQRVAQESEVFDGEQVVVTRTFENVPVPLPMEISDRQFAHALKKLGTITQMEAMAFVQTGTIPAALQIVINTISDQETREDAELLVAGATVFRRTHPMTETLRQGLGMSEQELDNLWREAAAL